MALQGLQGSLRCEGTRDHRATGPTSLPYSRFLVLVALETAHLTRVHLGRVDVRVDHELILANAGEGTSDVRLEG